MQTLFIGELTGRISDYKKSAFTGTLEPTFSGSKKKSERQLLKQLDKDKFQRTAKPGFREHKRPPKVRKIDLETTAVPIRKDNIDGMIVPVFEYVNKYPKKLVAEPNLTLRSQLQRDPSVHNTGTAFERITYFSKYLKEGMVGFYTPTGEHWFEGACKYLIKGSAGVDIPEELYPVYAEKCWSLLAKADNFWTSDEFVDYLKSMNQNTGVKATIEAINNIREAKKPFSSSISFGYNSELRFIPELLELGGVYSGTKLRLSYDDKPNDFDYPSIEHLYPHVEGGDDVNDICNYVLATSEANSRRSDIPLVDYLKGWDAEDYYRKNQDWKKATELRIEAEIKNLKLQQKVENLSQADKKRVQDILNDYYNGIPVIFEKLPELIKKAVATAIRKEKEKSLQALQSNGVFSKVSIA